MISGEMNAMMQQVQVNHNIWTAERKKSIEKINKIFGLNIECKFNNEDAIEQAKEDAKIKALSINVKGQNNNDDKGGKKDDE